MSILCIYIIDVTTLICNYFVVAKTPQKPYAKTPQKPHKNLRQKPYKNLVQQKLLYIFKHSNKTLCKQNFICY